MKTSLILIFALGAACAGRAQESVNTSVLSRFDMLHIRDPFVLADPSDSTYYLFGTNQTSDGYAGYRSKDLESWEGPFPLSRNDAAFRGAKDFWAPECHMYGGKYYLFTTARSRTDSLPGSYIFVADTPLGPYREHSEGCVTPEGWRSLDGTLHIDGKGDPWLIFCHEWTQVGDGTIEAVRLSRDLKKALGRPQTLFSASSASWVRSHEPDGNRFVADGPFPYRNKKGELLILWSSFGEYGYAIGVARSPGGEILGPWEQSPQPLSEGDSGQGMLFRTFGGELRLCLHCPNRPPVEKLFFYSLKETGDGLLDEPAMIVGPPRQKKPERTR